MYNREDGISYTTWLIKRKFNTWRDWAIRKKALIELYPTPEELAPNIEKLLFDIADLKETSSFTNSIMTVIILQADYNNIAQEWLKEE